MRQWWPAHTCMSTHRRNKNDCQNLYATNYSRPSFRRPLHYNVKSLSSFTDPLLTSRTSKPAVLPLRKNYEDYSYTVAQIILCHRLICFLLRVLIYWVKALFNEEDDKISTYKVVVKRSRQQWSINKTLQSLENHNNHTTKKIQFFLWIKLSIKYFYLLTF